MDIANALTFAGRHHRAVLVTHRRSGAVQASPVNAGVLNGRVVISARGRRAKVSNIRRHAAASIVVMTDEFYGPWVQIDGAAEIVDQPAALPLLDEVYRAIAGEHPDWADYRAAMIRDERVVISLRPEHAAGEIA